MSETHLREIGLDVERVVAEVDFLETYAEFTLGELGADWVEPELPDDDARWTSMIDAASAFREAAQWALCFDPLRARRLLDRSGDLFLAVEQPFGSYLKVVSGAWYRDPPLDGFMRQLRALDALGQPTDRVEIAAPEPLLHPQQQAYLLLAAAASPRISREFGELLREIATTSPHRAGVVPVGALGMPIRRFWRMASILLGLPPASLTDPSQDPVDAFAAELVTLAQSYEESVELARTNEHTWINAAAPVDVGDIDIIGMAVIAARHYGPPLQQDLTGRVRDLPYAARAVLEIALEYVSAERDSGPFAEPDSL
jgi:hypothetical protein